MLRIVPWYAALLALLFVVLAVRVIGSRRSERITIGAGRSAALERRIRVHANFAEYVPFTLLLLSMAELRGASPVLLHLLCLVLLAGRLSHAWGVSQDPEDFRFRTAGMGSTFAVLVGGATLIAAT